MARISTSASYEASKRRYVANLDGEKIVLLKGVDKTPVNDDIAAEKYELEKAVHRVQTTGDRSQIWIVLNEWLAYLERRPTNPVAPNTRERHARVVQSFIDVCGKLAARDIRARHIEEWLARMREPYPHPVNKKMVRWEDGTVRLALGTMRQAFKWANGRGLLTANPFNGKDADALRNPTVVYAGRRRAIEQDEHDALLRLAVTRSNKDFAMLLILLHGTGARPSELIQAHADEWDQQKKAFVIDANDPANKGRFKLMRLKKDRIIHIPDELVPFVSLLVAKYADAPKVSNGQGRLIRPLFRDKHAKAFTIGSVNARFTSSRKKVNKDAGREVVRPGITPYSYRHGYVTRWLMEECGMDSIKALADLLGTSVLMIERHYSHLFTKHDVLRNRLNRFQAAGRRDANQPPAGRAEASS